MKFMKYPIFILVLTLLVAIYTEAQIPQKLGTIEGSVVEGNGAAVPVVRVTLLEPGGKVSIRQTLTDADGKYSFAGVPAGRYEIELTSTQIKRTLRRHVDATSSGTVVMNFVFSYEPCSEDGIKFKSDVVPDPLRAEVVRKLIELSFGLGPMASETDRGGKEIILVPRNINPDWLTPVQKSRLSVMTREQVQALTDQGDSRLYYSVSTITKRGDCIGISMLENVTIKGQIEDANMAGGATVYEFRKIDGRWVGEVLVRWIS